MRTIGERVKAVMEVGETRLVSDLAKSLRCKRDDIENCVFDVDGLDLIVGIQAGNAIAEHPPSSWEIERYE